MDEFNIDWQLMLNHSAHLLVALVLSLPVAFNREYKTNNAGLRTFPLVALASCAFMLMGLHIFNDSVEAQARVMYGIITGMGFIGGGAIIKYKNHVGGTATAAGMWNTAAIGVAVAIDLFGIALILSMVGFLIFQFIGPIKHQKGSMTKPKETETQNTP